MAEPRRKFDQDFKEGAVQLVRETGKPIAQVARDLGINEGTLGNWVNAGKRQKRRRRSTTRPGNGRWRAPHLADRDFPAATIDRKWYADGTEITTDEGKLYLAVTWNHRRVSLRTPMVAHGNVPCRLRGRVLRA